MDQSKTIEKFKDNTKIAEVLMVFVFIYIGEFWYDTVTSGLG